MDLNLTRVRYIRVVVSIIYNVTNNLNQNCIKNIKDFDNDSLHNNRLL